jgi:hypothetical protein
MSSRTVMSALGVAASITAMPLGASDAQVASYQTRGDLKPAHNLACIAIDQVSNVYTPADLMVAQSKCMQAGRFGDAMVLRLVAGTYSRFDALRVTDATAHDAYAALKADYPPDAKAFPHMKDMSAKYQAASSPEMAKFCLNIRRLGPPNYYPAYMIDHGMGAVLGTGGGLVKGFEAPKAWKAVLTQYMRCDVAEAK